VRYDDLLQRNLTMATRRSVSEIFKHVTSSKKIYYILMVLGGLVAFISLIRSCTVSSNINDRYLIGQDSRWNELNLLGKERNVTAFNSDILSTIATNDKISIRLSIGDENQLMRELRSKEIQGILTNVKPNFSNQTQFVFSKPYFLTGPVLAITTSQPIEEWNQKAKKMIGVSATILNSVNLEQDAKLQLRLYNDLFHALSDLNDEKIDGVVFPALQMQIYIQAFYPKRLRIVTTPLNDDGIRLMALNDAKGKALIERFNIGLEKIREDGTYDRLLEHWGFSNVEKIN
jgi:polar amino acid transport system substrate-binding protein